MESIATTAALPAIDNASSERFLTTFYQHCEAREKQISNCTTVDGLRLVISSIFALHEEFSANCHLLTAYDARCVQETLDTLDKLCRKARDKLAAKPKFSFRSKRSRKPLAESLKSSHQDVKTSRIPSMHSSGIKELRTNEVEIKERCGEKIVFTRMQLQTKDVVLSDLARCEVYLIGTIGAVRGENIKDCLVITGPVNGSVLLRGCQECTVHSAARQFRIHDSSSSDFFLWTTSGPIIENCRILRFAPYDVSYPGLEEDFSSIGLRSPKVDGESQWDNVKDFNWLRQEPSPNWSILQESERPEPHNLSGLCLGEDERY